MEFTDVLRRRRMVRNYRTDPVSDDVLQRVVSVVHRAPSAGFAQGHRLVVVTDSDTRAALAAVAEPWYLDHGYEPWISRAPVQIVIGTREASYHERYTEPDKAEPDGAEIPWPVPFWWFDCGGLFVLLQLAAINEGLATGFYSPAPPEELTALAAAANLGNDIAIAGIMTLGYAADDPTTPSRARIAERRKATDDLVRWT